MRTSVSVKSYKQQVTKQDLGLLTLGVICKLIRDTSDLVLLIVEPSCTELEHVCGKDCGLLARDGCLTTCSKVKIQTFLTIVLLPFRLYRLSTIQKMTTFAHQR